MCDVLIATPKATENGEMIFAKNSDRDPNEAQILEFIPRKEHSEEKVKLTYIEFPQVKETYAVILSRPWWMWGAEMGANEFGLVIGNTAVFTKEPYEKVGILGMDMIRLALERTKTAKEALDFIISIIEEYGQGGNGSYEHKLYYHNSFIIADPKEAWVLETAGKYWVTKKIKDVYSISNALTIGNNWDLASKGVEKLAKEKRDFNFAKYFSDRFYTHFAYGRERRAFTYQKLKEKEGEISLEYMMEILRSHQVEPFNPEKGSMRDICMHFGGLTRPSQTASSQISELTENFQVHWFTGTSIPCLSIFKPFYFEAPLNLGEKATNKYDPNTYWWQFEAFHRKFQTNYRAYIEEFSKERDALQKKIIEKERDVRDRYLKGEAAKEELSSLTKWAFEKEKNLLERWNAKIKPRKLSFLYGRNWKKVNESAGLKF
jgi:dipeptidase